MNLLQNAEASGVLQQVLGAAASAQSAGTSAPQGTVGTASANAGIFGRSPQLVRSDFELIVLDLLNARQESEALRKENTVLREELVKVHNFLVGMKQSNSELFAQMCSGAAPAPAPAAATATATTSAFNTPPAATGQVRDQSSLFSLHQNLQTLLGAHKAATATVVTAPQVGKPPTQQVVGADMRHTGVDAKQQQQQVTGSNTASTAPTAAVVGGPGQLPQVGIAKMEHLGSWQSTSDQLKTLAPLLQRIQQGGLMHSATSQDMTQRTFSDSVKKRLIEDIDQNLNNTCTTTHTRKDGTRKRSRGLNLPRKAVKHLKGWVYDHFDNPYPSENEKAVLAEKLGLNHVQVNTWFINARMRLWKPVMEKLFSSMKERVEKRLSETESDKEKEELTALAAKLQKVHEGDDSRTKVAFLMTDPKSEKIVQETRTKLALKLESETCDDIWDDEINTDV